METDFTNQETFVCYSCLQPNEIDRNICKFCNAPISQNSSNDPLQIAYGEGMVYRKATESKPKMIIVLGIWLLFFPAFIFGAYTAIETVLTQSGSVGFVLFWLMFAIAVFSFVMLYKVTKNYLYFEETPRN